jgi:tetratricopeptide (TPR) repeat protein
MKNSANYFLKFFVLIAAILFCVGFSSKTSANISTNPQFYQGINSLNQQNYHQAILEFTQVIDENNQLVASAYANRCLAHLQLNNNQAAQQDCYQALGMNSDNIEAYLNQGIANYRLGNYPQALAAYQEVIKRNKHDYRAYYNQGLVYFQLANYQQALSCYNQALNGHNGHFTAHKSLMYYDRALVYLKLENFPKAIADLTHVIILNQTDEKAYYQRGYAYQKLGNYRDAFRDFTEVISLNNQLTMAYINRGITAANLGFQQAAFKDFKIALNQFKEQKKMKDHQQTLKLIQKIKQITAQTSQSLVA